MEMEPEMEPKICPKCSEKNHPEFTECWKCRHSFLPWNKRVLFCLESISSKLVSLGRYILKCLKFIFFVGMCLFCWGLVSNVILGEMTTGQYIHKINVDLKQNKQTIQQAIRNEWRGPIFETLNRITIVGGNGPVRKYFGNGHLKSEILYKNGEREGKARLYYENGRVRAESFYKDGKLVGKVKEYYENGFLKREGATTEAVEQLR